MSTGEPLEEGQWYALPSGRWALSTRHLPSPAELARINELLGQRAVEQRAVEEAGKQRG